MADKGRRRLTETVDEAVRIGLDNKARCRSCHGFRPQAVDGRLDEDVGQGKNHALNPGRQADTDNMAQFFLRKVKVMQIHANPVRRPTEQNQENQGVGHVSDNSRPGDAGDAEIKDGNRQEAEDDIDAVGNDQAVKGCLAVAAAAENSCFKIVQ